MSKAIAKINQLSSDLILGDNREYAIYVCQQRAIPKIEDGLKNGQRIALWLLRNRAEKIKTFALAGLMGYEKLYVHGEASANNAISLLAAPYKNNQPLIEGHGQFGSRLKPVDGIGAPRYTEVRRSKPSEAFLYQDLDLIPLEDNYDGSNVQPQHFLPLIPNVLLNGVSGVAVGWSTEILPRKLKGLIQATQDALAGRPIKGLEPHMERYNIGVRNIAGNQWEFSGKATVIDTSTIHITELPPSLDIEDFRTRLIKMEDDDLIKSYTDRSAVGVNIQVKFLRGKVAGWTDDKCLDFFKLREKVTERIVVVDWGGQTISTYPSAEKVVEDFVAWRLGWYTKRFEKMLSDALYELNYWHALRALFKNSFPKRLGTFADRQAVEDDVTTVVTKAKLVLDDKQLDRVVNLPTYRWTKAFEQEVDRRIAEIDLSIKDYQDILKSPDRLKAVYNDELEELKKIKL
jgi:DNA topoisomerase-2